MDPLTIAVLAPTLFSACAYLLVLSAFALSAKRRGAPSRPIATPSVSVLKPIAGADEELRDNLESFARLDYDDYELLLGLASKGDPAVPIVRQFLAAHPELRAAIVWTDPRRALNPKVAQLLELTAQAKGSVIVVSDANVRVSPGYLRSVLDRLMRPGVGLVSNVVRGTGERSLGALVENAQLGAFVAPVVMASVLLADRAITVGKSMAMRRVDLERVGGWRSVANVLAEDDVMGRRFHDHGFAVDVCAEPVDNRNIDAGLARCIERHTRWAKMRRAIAPRYFAFEPLLSPLATATLVAAAVPSRIAVATWALAALLQTSGAALTHRLGRGAWSWRLVAIEPLRVHVSLFCWARAWMSRRVEWRGHAFTLREGSTLVPIGGRAALERASGAEGRGAIG